MMRLTSVNFMMILLLSTLAKCVGPQPIKQNNDFPSGLSTSAIPLQPLKLTGVIVSESENNQFDPAINDKWVTWSEKIGPFRQIMIFNRITNVSQQLTTDDFDHMHPVLSKDYIVWEQSESATTLAGKNLLTLESITIPKLPLFRPKLFDVWLFALGEMDINSLSVPIYKINLENQTVEMIATGIGTTDLDANESMVVWEDWRDSLNNQRQADLYLYNFTDQKESIIANLKGDQEAPQLAESYVIWRDSRNNEAFGNYDIYGMHLGSGYEVNIALHEGLAVEPKASGRYVVWSDQKNVYVYDLQLLQLIATTDDGYLNLTPEVDDHWVVWVRGENPGPQARSQIVYIALETRP